MHTIFFWLSKIGWIFISPLNLIFGLLVVTWVLFLLNAPRHARLLFSCIIILLLIIGFFPIGNVLLRPLERRFETNPVLPGNVEGIIVLGGSMNPILSAFWNQVETGGAIERELTFMNLSRNYPSAKLVYTGGSPNLLNNQYKEADAANKLFRELDFDTSRIVYERNARNTYENVMVSMDKVKPELKYPWILITSAYHIPRAVGTFCKQGWKVIPYPVDHNTLPDDHLRIEFNLAGHIGELDLAIHEWLGLFVYYVTGKTVAFFPGHCE